MHCIVRAKKTRKEHTSEVEGLVWDMLCLVKDVCKTAKGINKLQKEIWVSDINLGAFGFMMVIRGKGINYIN